MSASCIYVFFGIVAQPPSLADGKHGIQRWTKASVCTAFALSWLPDSATRSSGDRSAKRRRSAQSPEAAWSASKSAAMKFRQLLRVTSWRVDADRRKFSLKLTTAWSVWPLDAWCMMCCICICSASWLFCLSCQYLPRLQRLLWQLSFTARSLSPQSPGWRALLTLSVQSIVLLCVCRVPTQYISYS